jgi:phage-related protein
MKLAFAAAADSIAVALLPAFEGLTDIVLKLTPIIEANGGAIGKALLVFGAFAAAIIALNYAIKAYIVITQIVKAATVAWTFAQSALNVALFANPIGLVVLAIVALIAGLVLAYQKSEAFRNMIQQLWEWLKIIGTFIKDVIVGYFNLWVTAIKTVITWVQKLVDKFNLLDKFKGLFGTSTTLSGSISQTSTNNSQNGSRASVYMNDEMLARGISRILQNSDQRNGGSLAFS